MMLRGEVADIIFGSIFLFVGLAACCIAAIRRRGGVRIFLWLGLWSAMYGAAHLTHSSSVIAVSPHWLQVSAPYANMAMGYLLIVVAALSFLELSLGKVRLLLKGAVFAGLAIAVAGIILFLLTGSNERLMNYNSLLAAVILLVLTPVSAVPGLSRKYLVLTDRGVLSGSTHVVLTIGTLVFALEALYNNLSGFVGFESPRILDHLGFAVLLFSFGYVAIQLVFASERRLLSIENELATAREIQTSILPSCVPKINDLCISAAYHPMTAVAGDFYEFIPVDRNRLGILVADVSGHGVPAALIASMIKVAAHSVVPCADNPRAVLSGLNRILSAHLRGQLVSAAYLWIDTENRTARYAAAGHPPLLRWRQDGLERIESNGLLFGVLKECEDYPVCVMPIHPGDRFLLCTDGVTESENANGDSFGDTRLEEVVRDHRRHPSHELSDRLLAEIRLWQPAPVNQQDDITLIIVDVV